MNIIRKHASRLGACLALVGLLNASYCEQAKSEGYEQDVAPPVEGMTITECVVYSKTDKTLTYNCTPAASKVCNGLGKCELPIGLALSGGKDLDNNPDNWKKVRVRYKCGGKEFTRGPHDQNDHASMILTC